MIQLYCTGALQTSQEQLIADGWEPCLSPQSAEVVFVRYDHLPPSALSMNCRAVCTNMTDPQWSLDYPRVFTARDIPQSVLHSVTPTIEHTWGLILAAHRRLPLEPWKGRDKYIAPKMLSRSTIGILGLGRIGYGVLRVAHAFGMHVKALEKSPIPLADRVQDIDVLVCCISREDNVNPVIDAAALSALPKDAIVVNTAYGEALDLNALCVELIVGHLWGAGLDVLPAEVPDIDERMIKMLLGNRLFITPHIAGSTLDARIETERALLQRVRSYLELGE